MDIRKIRKLIELINETGIGEIEVSSGEESVRISRAPSPGSYATPPNAPLLIPASAPNAPSAPAPAVASSVPVTIAKTAKGHVLRSPMVGTAYLSPTPGAKAFVDIGQRVEVGDTVCFVEAMKMFNKIEADRAGILVEKLIQNEEPVEFDQPLFVIDEG